MTAICSFVSATSHIVNALYARGYVCDKSFLKRLFQEYSVVSQSLEALKRPWDTAEIVFLLFLFTYKYKVGGSLLSVCSSGDVLC